MFRRHSALYLLTLTTGAIAIDSGQICVKKCNCYLHIWNYENAKHFENCSCGAPHCKIIKVNCLKLIIWRPSIFIFYIHKKKLNCTFLFKFYPLFVICNTSVVSSCLHIDAVYLSMILPTHLLSCKAIYFQSRWGTRGRFIWVKFKSIQPSDLWGIRHTMYALVLL